MNKPEGKKTTICRYLADADEFAYWNSMTNLHVVTNAATGILFLDSHGEYR